MKTSKIAFFAVLLFILQTAAVTACVLATGAEETGRLAVVEYIANAVISICMFAYISCIHPTRPYLTSLIVGALAAILNVLFFVILIGDISWWNPVTLVFDVSFLLATVLLGVALGSMYRRRCVANG